VNAIDRSEIQEAVEKVWSRLRIKPTTVRRGPVQLAPFMESYNLLHVALPNLSTGVVYDYLRKQGITPTDMGDEDKDLAGFLYVTPSVGLAFVNASDPVPRQRFSAAHELGHFVLHRDQMHGVSFADTPEEIKLTVKQSNRHEREANRFAVELLMPTEVCKERANAFRKAYKVWPRSPLSHHLAAELLVSGEAMKYRLEELAVGDA
jgi:Zn-dependent peptidase ImmA (M78 family)